MLTLDYKFLMLLEFYMQKSLNKVMCLILSFLLIALPIISGILKTSTYAIADDCYQAEDIPKITFPNMEQSGFLDAFNVINEAKVDANAQSPADGMIYPFIAPGGAYTSANTYWQLDSSLAMSGLKWANQSFAENMLRNFIYVQKENGRIPQYGLDNWKYNNSEPTSSLPALLEVAYDVVTRTKDMTLIRSTYNMIKRYVDWWFSARYDNITGCLKSTGEEWLPGNLSIYTISVQTNVLIASGIKNLIKIAEYLEIADDVSTYSQKLEDLKDAISANLWNSEKGCYMDLQLNGNNRTFNGSVYSVTGFDAFRLNIASPTHIEKMITALTDNNLFQWDTIALTTAAKTDPAYNETPGTYAAVQWNGSIWSIRNYSVIQGLNDIGRYDLSSYLSLKTVNQFYNNYAEFLNPPDGTGHGETRYSWTASQFIQILIEQIFGVSYNLWDNTLTICPHLDSSLYNQTLKLENLKLYNGTTLDLSITPTENRITIEYKINGQSYLDVNVCLPTVNSQLTVYEKEYQENKSGYGTILTVAADKSSDKVIFLSRDENNSNGNVSTDKDNNSGINYRVLGCNGTVATSSIILPAICIIGAIIFKKNRQ